MSYRAIASLNRGMTSARHHAMHVTIGVPLTRADLPGLIRRVGRLLDREVPVDVVCDLDGLRGADAVLVDGLAQIALEARRRGCGVRLAHPPAELCELVALMGLTDVLGDASTGGTAAGA